MNPMLISLMLPMAQKFLAGGGKADDLKDLIGEETKPETQMVALVASLASHLPEDSDKLEECIKAIEQTLRGLADLKRATS